MHEALRLAMMTNGDPLPELPVAPLRCDLYAVGGGSLPIPVTKAVVRVPTIHRW
jgi:hypothetical protein